MGLLPRQINVEGQQRDQAYDRHVIWSRANLPKLSPVHTLSKNLNPRTLWGRPPSAVRVEQSSTISVPSASQPNDNRAALGGQPLRLRSGQAWELSPHKPLLLSCCFRSSARLICFCFQHHRGWARNSAVFPHAPEVHDHQN